MAEEAGDVPQSVRLKTVDRVVVVPETLVEGHRPCLVEFTKPFA